MTTHTTDAAQDFAHTVLAQIKAADPWCLAACGARNYAVSGPCDAHRGQLTFRVTIDGPRVDQRVRITLTHADTYTVELFKIGRAPHYRVTIEATREDVYCDVLAQVVYRLCNR